MLNGIFFMFKMIGLTILVVLVMQFKLGEKTIEHEVHQWLQDSVFVDYVQTSIDGGVKLTKAGYQKLHASVNSVFNKMSRKGGNKEDRGIALEVKRSKSSGYGEKENGEENSLPRIRFKNSTAE